MKKILFVLPNLQGGGAERVTLNFIKEIDREQFIPVLFLLKNEGVYFKDIPKNVEVHTALQSGQSVSRNILRIIKKLINVSSSCDLIIGGLELTATYFVALVGKILRKPTIGWVHTNLKYYPSAKNKINKFLIKLFYSDLNRILCVSDGVKDDFRKLYPHIPDHRVIRLYNVFPNQQKDPLDQSKINSNSPIIIGMGRLGHEKGFDLLIQAHAEVIKEGLSHELVILGEGNERGNLEKLIEDLNVNETVKLMGFIDTPSEWLKKTSLFVLSSRFEGFGMVLLEAMSAGVPIVSTRCDGPVEILQEGKFGRLVPVEDSTLLAKEIMQLLSDKDARENYSNLGLERVKDFEPHTIMPQFHQILNEVCSKK
ncbi:hypothetical protein Elgi_05610 [Paenibacillus elgii]|uniref:glycosyltransferase n=1 Tax=Paenibacillus elgii TaxID=189691 RepID=UPI002D7C30A6|nr:hypothetical protein Elgi_05610 [Paenibacillus elgii]